VYTLLTCTAAAVHRASLYTRAGSVYYCFGSSVLIYIALFWQCIHSVHRCPDGQYTKAVYRQLLRCAATTGPASSLVFAFGCAARDAQYSEQHSEDSFYSALLATLKQPHDNTSALTDIYLLHMKARLPHLHKLLIEVQFTSAKGTACVVPDWLAGYIKVLSSIYSKLRQQVTVNCSASSGTCSSGELPADSNTLNIIDGAAVSIKQCAVLPARSSVSLQDDWEHGCVYSRAYRYRRDLPNFPLDKLNAQSRESRAVKKAGKCSKKHTASDLMSPGIFTLLCPHG
jgi:hypothetical protein